MSPRSLFLGIALAISLLALPVVADDGTGGNVFRQVLAMLQEALGAAGGDPSDSSQQDAGGEGEDDEAGGILIVGG